MNNKQLYKNVRHNVKENFWIYLVTVLIFFILNTAVSNGFGVFSDISKVISAIRNGSFNYQQLTTPDSQFWTYFYAGGSIATSTVVSIIMMAFSFFLINPLSVGIKAVFISGVDKRPTFEKVSTPFKTNYLNIVLTMLLSNLVLEMIVMGIAIVYTIAMGMVGTIVTAVSESVGMIVFLAASIILTILYLVFAIYVSYSFSMIAYILTEHPEYRISQALYFSRRMVHKKKWKVFRVDFHYLKWSALSVFIPIVLFAIGMMKMSLSVGGMLYIILAIFMIIPVLCVNVFISVFKESAWAHLYKELRIDTEDKATEVLESTTREDATEEDDE